MGIRGFLTLRISGDGLSNEETSKKLGVKSDTFNKKGEKHFNKITKTSIIYPEDCWYAGVEIEEEDSFEEVVVCFLKKLQPSAGYLKELSSSFDVTLWLDMYPDNEQMNVHLSNDIISIVSEMGITIDVGAMFLKQFYEGNY